MLRYNVIQELYNGRQLELTPEVLALGRNKKFFTIIQEGEGFDYQALPKHKVEKLSAFIKPQFNEQEETLKDKRHELKSAQVVEKRIQDAQSSPFTNLRASNQKSDLAIFNQMSYESGGSPFMKQLTIQGSMM